MEFKDYTNIYNDVTYDDLYAANADVKKISCIINKLYNKDISEHHPQRNLLIHSIIHIIEKICILVRNYNLLHLFSFKTPIFTSYEMKSPINNSS